ncbi:cation:proton antiporter [Flavobacterium croceum]|uniref:Transporter (CPA2 family) n=1 Tax=Flavobacterium croceum DSM 17960 TaxID=1121886 RepID=A0A2S4NA10_9FLAO|nr:cation:proton antiporter [Flavobacterium croceum]POS02293.1 transporter (CPA2 family) [Flavobacterium croceum DSM 17960]
MHFSLPSLELPFFVNLLLLLVVARIFGEIMERFKQPAMIGEILAGVLLGPSMLNFIHRTEDLKVISELGVFLLVIIAGLEINFDDIIKSIRGKNIVISLLAFFLPILSGFLVGHFYNQDVLTTIFIGLCVAITALPVSVRILMDLGKLNSPVGQRIISVAIFDDVIALTVLGILLDLKDVEKTFSTVTSTVVFTLLKLIFFLAIIAITYKFIRKFSKRENFIENQLNLILSYLKGKESLFAVFFVFILIFASITESIGLHFIIGAFFASMLISKDLIGEKHLETFHNTTNSMAMGFLAPIFFAGIGLEFQISSIENYGLLCAIIIVSFISKIAGGFIGGKFVGLNNRFSFALGIGLNARGIMELVIANIAYKSGIINIEIFSMLVIMGLVTTLATPIMLKKSLDRITE